MIKHPRELLPPGWLEKDANNHCWNFFSFPSSHYENVVTHSTWNDLSSVIMAQLWFHKWRFDLCKRGRRRKSKSLLDTRTLNNAARSSARELSTPRVSAVNTSQTLLSHHILPKSEFIIYTPKQLRVAFPAGYLWVFSYTRLWAPSFCYSCYLLLQH